MQTPTLFIILFVLALLAIGGPLLLWNVLVKKMVRPEPSEKVLALLKMGERLDAVQLYMQETGMAKEGAIDVLQQAENDMHGAAENPQPKVG